MNTIFVHRNGQTESGDQHRSQLARSGRRGKAVVPVGRSRGAVDSRIADPQRHVRLSPAVGRRRRAERQFPKIEAYDGYLVCRGRRRGRRHQRLRRSALPRHRPRRRVEGDRRPDRQRPARRQAVQRGPGRAVPPDRGRDGRRADAGRPGTACRCRRSREDGCSRSRLRMSSARSCGRAAMPSVLEQRLACEQAVVARLARREFVDISTEMSFRFRRVLRSPRPPERAIFSGSSTG